MAKRFRKGTVLAAGLVAGVTAAASARAESFTNFFIFGDSLSDAGTFRVASAPNVGLRFTTNPSLEWDQILGAEYGINVSPYKAIVANSTLSGILSDTVIGGNNYAQGGACVASGYSATCPINPLNDLGVTQQIAAYLNSAGKADPNALYSVYSGGNNVFSALALVEGGKLTLAQALTGLSTAGTVEAQNVATLVAAGAHTIIVPSLGNVGDTPFGHSLGSLVSGVLNTATANYNTALNAGLQQIQGGNIVYADLNHLVREISASPTVYGFTNVTTPICPNVSTANLCNASTETPGADPTKYLYADNVHPTGTAQLGVAQFVQSLLLAPGEIGLLADTPIYTARGALNGLDDRTLSSVRASQGWIAFADFAYTPFTADGNGSNSTGVDGSSNGGYGGLEYGASNGFRIGLQVGYSDGNYSFSQGLGNFDSDMTLGTVYLTYTSGPIWAQASGSFGSIDYNGIDRFTTLLADTRVDSGSTHGSYSGGRLVVGYDLPYGGMTVTPLAGLTYQDVVVTSYAEQQTDSTAEAFGGQHAQSIFATVGARVSTVIDVNGVAVEPRAELRYNHDFANTNRNVEATPSGAPVSYTMPVSFKPGKDWGTLSAGASVAVTSQLAVQISGGGDVGQSGTSSTFINGSVAFQF